MIGLGIHTSISPYSIALVNEDKVLGELSVVASHDFGEHLIDEINSLAQKAGVSLSDIQVIGVTHGPGSYTGIRIGVTVAKSISQVQQIPVFGVSTLDSFMQSWGAEGTGFVIIPAVKHEFNCCLYTKSGSQITPLSDEIIWTEDQLIDKLSAFQSPIVIITSDDRSIPEVIKSQKNVTVMVLGIRGSAVAFCGIHDLKMGQKGDYNDVVAHYSHLPTIGPKKEGKS